MPLEVEPSLRRALGLHQVLPSQQPGAASTSAGVRRFYIALLALAVDEAGLGPRRGPVALPPTATPVARAQVRRRAAARVLARRWLLGELDGDVVVPITVACGALGLDAEAVADAVRRLSARPLRPPRAIAPACAPVAERRCAARAALARRRPPSSVGPARAEPQAAAR
jgi:hypothetical protein